MRIKLEIRMLFLQIYRFIAKRNKVYLFHWQNSHNLIIILMRFRNVKAKDFYADKYATIYWKMTILRTVESQS